jgi:autotransporter-associated beta strand protein
VNTYPGDTTITTGTLTISGAGQLGSGSYSGNISNAGVFKYASSANQTLSGTISGTGALIKNGNGTLTLSDANTYTGATTITAGTLSVSAASAMGATTQVILNSGGSLLIGASSSINDGAAVTLAGGKVEFTGSINETLGALSVTTESIIDMAGGNITLEFAALDAAISACILKVYNYTLYSDHLYFTSNTNLTPTTLSNIRFYSDGGSSFIGNSFVENSLSGPYQVRPVPEPETYATAALLLIGLGIYAYRRRQSTSSQAS